MHHFCLLTALTIIIPSFCWADKDPVIKRDCGTHLAKEFESDSRGTLASFILTFFPDHILEYGRTLAKFHDWRLYERSGIRNGREVDSFEASLEQGNWRIRIRWDLDDSHIGFSVGFIASDSSDPRVPTMHLFLDSLFAKAERKLGIGRAEVARLFEMGVYDIIKNGDPPTVDYYIADWIVFMPDLGPHLFINPQFNLLGMEFVSLLITQLETSEDPLLKPPVIDGVTVDFIPSGPGAIYLRRITSEDKGTEKIEMQLGHAYEANLGESRTRRDIEAQEERLLQELRTQGFIVRKTHHRVFSIEMPAAQDRLDMNRIKTILENTLFKKKDT